MVMELKWLFEDSYLCAMLRLC